MYNEYFEKDKAYKIVLGNDGILETRAGEQGKSRKKERQVFKTEKDLSSAISRIKKELLDSGYVIKDEPSSCFKTSGIEVIDKTTLILSGKMAFGSLFYKKEYTLSCSGVSQNAWYVGGCEDNGRTLTFGPIDPAQGSKKYKLRFEVLGGVNDAWTGYKGLVEVGKSEALHADYPLSRFGNLPDIERVELELDRLLPNELTNYYHVAQGNGVNVNGHGYIYKTILDNTGTFAQVTICRALFPQSNLVPLAICLPDKVPFEKPELLKSIAASQIGLFCLDMKDNQGNGKVVLIKNGGDRIELFETLWDLTRYCIQAK